MAEPNKFEGRYQVADGYAGGARPMYFSIYPEDVADEDNEASLSGLYEELMVQHFRENVYAEGSNESEFIEWAKSVQDSRREGRDDNAD